MTKEISIAIVGASFAGLSAYIKLKKKFPKATFYLFDKEECFTYMPSLHITLCDEKYIEKIQFSLKKYFKESFIQDEVISIKKNSLTTKTKTYHFDYAVVSTGARVNCYGNTTLEQAGYGAKSFPHIKKLWSLLPKAKKILIIGGGLSGVEYAAMLAQKTDKEITLVSGSDMVLPGLLQGGREYAHNYLKRVGVTIIDNALAAKATKNSVTLNNGQTIKTDIIMICTGLLQSCDFLKNTQVTDALHLQDMDTIFLCGDVVRTPKVPTAHAAMVEGAMVAQNIINTINGREISPRQIKKSPIAVALGPHHGFIQVKSWYIPTLFTGFLKKNIERFILFSYKHRL